MFNFFRENLIDQRLRNTCRVFKVNRILKPDGMMVHLIPTRNSTFGFAARIFPFEKLKKLLHLAVPEAKGQVEFPIFYDNCTPKKIHDFLDDLGSKEREVALLHFNFECSINLQS